MNEKPKQLWINALKSGQYKQYCGAMIDEDLEELEGLKCEKKSMCVMGVLAHVALEAANLKLTLANWKKFSDNNEYPTDRTVKWAGLSWDEVEKLIDTNDARKMTFKEFANHIENQY